MGQGQGVDGLSRGKVGAGFGLSGIGGLGTVGLGNVRLRSVGLRNAGLHSVRLRGVGLRSAGQCLRQRDEQVDQPGLVVQAQVQRGVQRVQPGRKKPVQPRRFQIPIDHQHRIGGALFTLGQHAGGIGQRHRAAGAALVRVEGDGAAQP